MSVSSPSAVWLEKLRRPHFRILFALSLANLCLIKIWHQALISTPASDPHRFLNSTAAILNTLIVAGVFFAMLSFASAYENRLLQTTVQLGIVVPVVLILDGIRFNIGISPVEIAGQLFRAAPLAIGIVAFLLLVKYRRTAMRLYTLLLLFLSPFILFTFGQAVTGLLTQRAVTMKAEENLSPIAPGSSGRARVLWFIFDELDQHVLFTERPSSLAVPEIDRLRGEAFYATKALPPADVTQLSLPAYIAGELVEDVRLVPNSASLRLHGSQEYLPWGSRANLFKDAIQAGIRTDLMGWYLPYCHVLGRYVANCWDEFILDKPQLRKESLGDTMLTQLWELLPSSSRVQKIDMYKTMLERTQKAALDPGLGLVFVHWPIPHGPSIYDRNNDDFRISAKGGLDAYLDDVRLVDRTIGAIRQDMTAAGIWDKTTVLVTSDHFWRFAPGEKHQEIPFLLKLAGQQQPLTYEQPFNTVIARSLVMAVLEGEVTTAEGVSTWLDRAATGDGKLGTTLK